MSVWKHPGSAAFGGLLIILAIAAALRFSGLGRESLWLDEAISIQISHGSLAEIVHDTAEDVHPPLYYFMLHAWMSVAGDSERAARALSALFGVVTVAMVYLLAARLFDPVTGVVAALLIAVSPFHLAASQEARMYALLTLVSLCSMDRFVRLLEAPGRAAFVGYVVATTAMLYTHVYAAFIAGAQTLALAALLAAARPTYLRVWRRVLLAQATALILFLPWVERLFRQVLFVEHGFWIPPNATPALLKTLVLYAGSAEVAWVWIPLAVLPLAFGPGRRRALFLLLWLACLVVLPFVLSKVVAPIFAPKYTIAGSVAFVLLAARGLTLLPSRVLQAAVAVALMGVSVAPLRHYYGTMQKDPWRTMVASVESAAQPRDLVLFNQPYGQIPFDYYRKRSDLIEVPFLEYREGLTSRSVRELVRVATAGHDRVWLVLSNSDAVTPLMVDTLGATRGAAIHLVDRGIELYLFVK
jgi:mannosyltransferase